MTSTASSQPHQTSTEDIKPILEESLDEEDYDGSSPEGDDAPANGGAPGVKRPRLRLAHACDRCRKRKIRCDTQQPCGPCSAAHSECTFHTPTRRTSKPKTALADGGVHRAAKRPHSPPREALEARLAALESMLRDVPPNVHNAFLSSLDARLGSGTGIGLNEGKGDGVGVAPEALVGGSSTDWSALYPGWNANGGFPGDTTLAPGLGIGSSRSKPKEDGIEAMAKKMEGMSFFYEDEIGQAKWQGATSGFPLLDILTASQTSRQDSAPRDLSPESQPPRRSSSIGTASGSTPAPPAERFFPDRKPRPHQTLNPEASWKVITGVIPPDLMDTLVRCYLSTSHLLWPFLHVPSFLADYANPSQWGEPGFACFIVAVCTLSSRHVDDPRVRANATDPSTAGKSYFELFKRLRDLPSADRPTLYSIQAAFLAAIYAFGLGNLSKAFALQAESITLCLDGGLHRSVDGYDHFDAVEKETRKRTFWSIYSWDKQSAALFGRPPIIHLRDCDVTEPVVVDDEDLTAEGVKEGKNNDKSRMCAFVAAIRLHVVLEGVIESATQPSTFPTSPFLARASVLTRRPVATLGQEEDLLEEWTRLLPKYWAYDTDTANSRDPIRITQAERLHCLEHLVKMIIYRHRFSGFVSVPASTSEDRAKHLDLCRKAMQCALTIVADHVHISQRGMMTYYGVHVIHQLAQAGRTLVAVILNCRNADFRPLIAPAIEGLRSCVGLLRRFSGRYLCGLRSADIIDEFCRICNIPIDSPRVPDGTGRPPPAWLRPVRKRATPSPRASVSPAFGEDIMSAPRDLTSGPGFSGAANSNPPSLVLENGQGQGGHERNGSWSKADLDALFNGYFDLSAMSPESGNAPLPGTSFGAFGSPQISSTTPLTGFSNVVGGNPSSGVTTATGGGTGMFDFSMNNFDFGNSGAGGELLAGEGMDTVSDGLQGADQGMSAADILSLMEEGTFDYGAMFTDQAPISSDFAIRP